MALREPKLPRTVEIGLGHLGVTLSNHELGVRVVAANEADSIFSAGLRVGDVIISIDGIVVSDHGTACDLLGSNLDKPVVMQLGPQPRHVVEYYTAAVADEIVRSNSLPAMLMNAAAGLLTGGKVDTPAPAPGPDSAASSPNVSAPSQQSGGGGADGGGGGGGMLSLFSSKYYLAVVLLARFAYFVYGKHYKSSESGLHIDDADWDQL